MIDSRMVIINKSDVDLGEIDLLGTRKFYGHLQNFITIAIHNQLLCEEDLIEALNEESMLVGFIMFTRGGKAYRLA